MAAESDLRIGAVAPVFPSPAPGGAVLFADNFDRAFDRARYFEYNDAQGSFVWDPAGGLGGGGAMRCTFQPGQVTAGDLKVLFGRNPLRRGGIRPDEAFREIYWRVYVKHEAGWQGNPAKLARATAMAGADWSQGLIAHVWGGKGDALCIDPASGVTGGVKRSVRYNDFDRLRWLGVKHAHTPVFAPVESGRWVCVESRVRIDTPGRRDGVFTLWVDGKEEAHRDDLEWHGAWAEWGINAVFLENYWNSGSVKRQSRWFDGFVVSTRPIGPVATAGTPALLLSDRSAKPGRAWEAQLSADADGKDLVWEGRAPSEAVTVGGVTGRFLGSHAGRSALRAGATYWVRSRERGAAGWSPWHCPFRVVSTA